jgi:hypothetical protein
MILARGQKNHSQARTSHDPSRGCQNRKWRVSLEVSKAGAHGGGACVKVGLTKKRRLSFEQFDPRVPSTPKKDIVEMVDSTPGAVTLKPVTKEK